MRGSIGDAIDRGLELFTVRLGAIATCTHYVPSVIENPFLLHLFWHSCNFIAESIDVASSYLLKLMI